MSSSNHAEVGGGRQHLGLPKRFRHQLGQRHAFAAHGRGHREQEVEPFPRRCQQQHRAAFAQALAGVVAHQLRARLAEDRRRRCHRAAARASDRKLWRANDPAAGAGACGATEAAARSESSSRRSNSAMPKLFAVAASRCSPCCSSMSRGLEERQRRERGKRHERGQNEQEEQAPADATREVAPRRARSRVEVGRQSDELAVAGAHDIVAGGLCVERRPATSPSLPRL